VLFIHSSYDNYYSLFAGQHGRGLLGRAITGACPIRGRGWDKLAVHVTTQLRGARDGHGPSDHAKLYVQGAFAGHGWLQYQQEAWSGEVRDRLYGPRQEHEVCYQETGQCKLCTLVFKLPFVCLIFT